MYGGNFSNLSWSGDGGRSRLAETGNYIKLFLLSFAIFCFWSFVDWFGNGLNYLFLMHTRWRNSTSKENAFLSLSTDSICSLCNGNCFSVDNRLPADSLGTRFGSRQRLWEILIKTSPIATVKLSFKASPSDCFGQNSFEWNLKRNLRLTLRQRTSTEDDDKKC